MCRCFSILTFGLSFVHYLQRWLVRAHSRDFVSSSVCSLFHFRFLTSTPIGCMQCIILSILVAEWAKKRIARIKEYLYKFEFPLWLIFSFVFFFYEFVEWMQMGVVNAQRARALNCSLCSLTLICRAFVQIKCRAKKMVCEQVYRQCLICDTRTRARTLSAYSTIILNASYNGTNFDIILKIVCWCVPCFPPKMFKFVGLFFLS